MDQFWSCLGYPAQRLYGGFDLSELPMNYAYIVAETNTTEAGVYTVRDDCVGCLYTLQQKLEPSQKAVWRMDTSVTSTWRILNTARTLNISRNYRSGLICQLRPQLGEYGIYSLDIGKCQLDTEVEPINMYLPIFVWLALLSTILFIYSCVKVLIRHYHIKGNKEEEGLSLNVKPKPMKMASLYVFRGILITLLIFLTSGAGGYYSLLRDWGGITLAECLFYGYVWTVGAKIPFTVGKAFDKGATKCKVFTDVLKRSFVLLAVGAVIDSTVSKKWETNPYGIWCPFQKLGVAYFVAATSYTLTMQRFEMKNKNILCKAIANVISLVWCWLIAAFFLALQVIAITTFVSFNCQSNIGLEKPTSDLSNITEVNSACDPQTTEIANYVLMATPERVLYVNSYIAFSKGLLGVLSAVIQCMIGLKAGALYHHHETHGDRLKLWFLWAVLFSTTGVGIASAAMLLEFNLWPLAVGLLLSAAYICVFSIIYGVVEQWRILKLSVLVSCGVTSLLVLSGHVLFSWSLPFSWGHPMATHFEYLTRNIWLTALWLVIGWYLMKRKVRFSI